jgi:hypothetical protein
MKEEYLHFLWRMRFLPSRIFELEDGTQLEIIEFGEYNKNESGPDFFHSKLIIDGLLWFGHVEFHLKASDWNKHKHQFDPAYDHVILHIVWENDTPVEAKGRLLPTLLLSKYLKDDFSESHEKDTSKIKQLPCTYSLDDVPEVYIEREKEKSIYHRMCRKTHLFSQNPNDGFKQVLYELIAMAFGAKVNKDPFWQLTKEMPILRLLKMSQSKREKAIVASSGIENELGSSNHSASMKAFQWKKKGLHPNGAPAIRVDQFAAFIAHFDFDFGFLELDAKNLIVYVRKSFVLAEKENTKFSKPFQDLILVNAFVPFLWWLSEKRGDEKWQNKALHILELLPAENNHLTKFLKTAGFDMKSAYDTQALLELYSLRCSRKKCLTCGIGNKILTA